jgi:hypothetical protein
MCRCITGVAFVVLCSLSAVVDCPAATITVDLEGTGDS